MNTQNVNTAAQNLPKDGGEQFHQNVITVGQYFNHVRHGMGIVYAIHGEQNPSTIKHIGGIMSTGGNAKFDVVYHNGTRTQIPECILCSGLPYRILNDVAAQSEIETLLAEADNIEQEEKARKVQEETLFENTKEELKNATEYVHLIQGDDKYCGKLAAKNIRLEFKKFFKGQKFSVRMGHYGSLTIKWTDGPKKEEVKNITSKYKVGRFDAYQDYHYSEVSPFNCIFGGVDYIWLEREYSDNLIHEALGVLVDKYENYFKENPKPTVEDYRKGRLIDMGLDVSFHHFQREVSEILEVL